MIQNGEQITSRSWNQIRDFKTTLRLDSYLIILLGYTTWLYYSNINSDILLDYITCLILLGYTIDDITWLFTRLYAYYLIIGYINTCCWLNYLIILLGYTTWLYYSIIFLGDITQLYNSVIILCNATFIVKYSI